MARNTRDERFFRNVDDYAAFRASRGREPNRLSADLNEKRLARWLDNARSGALDITQERRAALDAVNPNWDTPRTQPWKRRLETYVSFLTEHGREPRLRAEDRAERTLAEWMRTQRSTADRLSADRVAALDAAVPNWHVRRRVAPTFEERVGEYAVFLATHRRDPGRSSDSAEEASLASWLYRQRLVATGVQAAALEAVSPGWRTRPAPAQPRRRRPDEANPDQLELFAA